jgi:hypothetical protein
MQYGSTHYPDEISAKTFKNLSMTFIFSKMVERASIHLLGPMTGTNVAEYRIQWDIM